MARVGLPTDPRGLNETTDPAGASPPGVRVSRAEVTMRLVHMTFAMPDDQSWEPEYWERIGIGPEWERLDKDFESAGAEVEGSEDIVVTCDHTAEDAVRDIISKARMGVYGPDVQTYWKAAKEIEAIEEVL